MMFWIGATVEGMLVWVGGCESTGVKSTRGWEWDRAAFGRA